MLYFLLSKLQQNFINVTCNILYSGIRSELVTRKDIIS